MNDMPLDDFMKRDWPAVRERLERSSFRSRFRLGEKDRRLVMEKGMEKIRGHARDFVFGRLASALPKNDGRQTPMRGHPVFVAQHATGTCCRKCLSQWHGLKPGVPLNESEVNYVVSVLLSWIQEQISGRGPAEWKSR